MAHATREVAFARELQERYPPTRTRPTVAAARAPASRSSCRSHGRAARALARDESHLELLRQLGLALVHLRAADARGADARRDHARRRRVGRASASATCGSPRSSRGARRPRSTTRASTSEAEQRAQAARVLETIADGVVLLDDDGVVRLWNAAAEAITGLAAREVVGRRADDVLPGLRRAGRARPASTASRRDGAARDRRPRAVALVLRRRASTTGIVYAFRDLTEERARRADEVRLRRDRLARAAHAAGRDLRRRGDAPPRPTSSSTTRLQRPAARGDRRRVRAGSREIVNDVLLASHLDSGQLQHDDRARATRRELAASVRRGRARRTSRRASTLELDAPERLPPVAADAQQLRQVLANLVENAIKYSPDGGPVTVALERARARSCASRCRDEGLGIPRRASAAHLREVLPPRSRT